MRPESFDIKPRIFPALVVLLIDLVLWVSCFLFGVEFGVYPSKGGY
jgi:hypothetical protein